MPPSPAGPAHRDDRDAGREVAEDGAVAVGIERARHAALVLAVRSRGRRTRTAPEGRRGHGRKSPDADPLVAAVRTIALKIVTADAGTSRLSPPAAVSCRARRRSPLSARRSCRARRACRGARPRRRRHTVPAADRHQPGALAGPQRRASREPASAIRAAHLQAVHHRAAVAHDELDAAGRDAHRLRHDAVLRQRQAQRRRIDRNRVRLAAARARQQAPPRPPQRAPRGREGIAAGFFRMMRGRMPRPTKSILLPLLALALALPLAACGEQKIEVAATSPQHAGAELFQQRCAGCHTFSAAATQGGSAANVRTRERTDGPNFNIRRECIERVLYAIENGGFSGAIMPQNIVVGEQAQTGRRVRRASTPARTRTAPRPAGTGSEANGFHCTRHERSRRRRADDGSSAGTGRPPCSTSGSSAAIPTPCAPRSRAAVTPTRTAIDALLDGRRALARADDAARDAAGRAERGDPRAARRPDRGAARAAAHARRARPRAVRRAGAAVARERDELLAALPNLPAEDAAPEDTVVREVGRGRQDAARTTSSWPASGSTWSAARACRAAASPTCAATSCCWSSRSCAARWRSSPARASSR